MVRLLSDTARPNLVNLLQTTNTLPFAMQRAALRLTLPLNWSTAQHTTSYPAVVSGLNPIR